MKIFIFFWSYSQKSLLENNLRQFKKNGWLAILVAVEETI